MEVLAALEGSGLATWLRQSVWAYPLVNAGHILGVALLVGAIVPLNLRLLGLWPAQPAAALARVLRPVAVSGLGLAATAGALLFSVRATEYAASPWFLGKLAVIALAIANALAFHALRRVSGKPVAEASGPATLQRATAGISLAAWVAALVLGRLIGYF